MGAFNIGDVILEKYEVTRVLGEGGMGVVLAARHLELDELVALKFLLPSFQAQPDICARFAREAKTGIRIKNEHVARVLDVGTLPDGAAFMVMEHLTGEDLATLLERRGVLPPHEAVDLLLQACEAIAEAHELGIVHRDLKPGNLFVTTGSDGLPFVKVLDFGISKTIVDVENVSVTATSAVLGSPLYMSPEQLASSRDVDRRADVWSLGVIFYEMVTGNPPFNGTSYPTLCAAILGGKYDRLARVAPGLPAELDLAVASALQLDREARTPSIATFAGSLAAYGSEAGKASSARIKRIAEHSVSASRSVVPAARPSGFDATLPLSEGGLAPPSAALPVAHSTSPLTGAGLARSGAVLEPSASPARASRSGAVVLFGAFLAVGIAFVAFRQLSPAATPATSGGPSSSTAASTPSSTNGPADMPSESPPSAASGVAGTRPDADARVDTAAAPPVGSVGVPPSRPEASPKRPRPSGPLSGPPGKKLLSPAPSADLFGSQK